MCLWNSGSGDVKLHSFVLRVNVDGGTPRTPPLCRRRPSRGPTLFETSSRRRSVAPVGTLRGPAPDPPLRSASSLFGGSSCSSSVLRLSRSVSLKEEEVLTYTGGCQSRSLRPSGDGRSSFSSRTPPSGLDPGWTIRTRQ